MVNYPSSIPLESLTEVWKIIKGGESKERQDELAWHTWNLQGFLFSVIFGDPSEVEKSLGMPQGAVLDKFVEHINSLNAGNFPSTPSNLA